jgi:hypothetical protein
VLARLSDLNVPDPRSDRIPAAIVLPAAGGYRRFEQLADQAERDRRDALVAGGLGDSGRRQRLDDQLGPARSA